MAGLTKKGVYPVEGTDAFVVSTETLKSQRTPLCVISVANIY